MQHNCPDEWVINDTFCNSFGHREYTYFAKLHSSVCCNERVSYNLSFLPVSPKEYFSRLQMPLKTTWLNIWNLFLRLGCTAAIELLQASSENCALCLLIWVRYIHACMRARGANPFLSIVEVRFPSSFSQIHCSPTFRLRQGLLLWTVRRPLLLLGLRPYGSPLV